MSREKGLCSLQVVSHRFVRGGGDEIDTCMSHPHGKSDMARPTSYPCKSKMCGNFSITKQLSIKMILSVLIRLYASAHRQVGIFWGNRGTAVKFRVDAVKPIAHPLS